MAVNDLFEAVIDGDKQGVLQSIQSSITEGISPEEILHDGIIAGMSEVGRLFEEGEFFVPEMLIAARAVKEGLAVLKPYLLQANIQPQGKVLIGTVKGDLHDIGKNLVSIMLEGAGYQIVDLGVDVDTAHFLEMIEKEKPDVVALSALLTTTMRSMEEVVQAVRQNVDGTVKIIVGGAPVTQKFADEIGADGYSADASKAVRLVESLMHA